ncbi:23S rRNA (uracil(1939)-C(5))-methyltransferase RlmD [Allobaculum stercoricanis]|uniref:23S rRNA (uracil(1939)-C(5))-methyltransferase RlmD n=1 Tax=Allobaculum stercoricanis TaxID=174709 RepID=UPI00037A464E|nr:23S rRNA (uracil(1939)-C(5))-methyltransferase RlmD [Allobaculum stercoricanis]
MKCPVGKLCGGCEYLPIEYAKQGALKHQAVCDLLEQNKLHLNVNPVHMAKSPVSYRNKVIYGFAKDRNKKVYSGLYVPKSHRVINSKGCKMQPRIVNEILDEITTLVDSMKIQLYSPKTGTGLLRHVMIRYAKATDQVMVVFVTAAREFPSRKNLVNALRQKFPQIKTIVQNVNSRDTSIVMQDQTLLLYGDGKITDELCGMKITFDSSSFYQIHHDQCEVLYNLAKEMLDLKPTDEVLDTYCGVGTIGLSLADACKQVTGVEINKQAIENARFNAKQNHIKNIRFLAMDSTRFMQEAARNHKPYNAIILDPPRAGTSMEFIKSACSLKPEKILYISCDPKTQARDLRQFAQNGYRGQVMELVDMFPYTKHVESLVLLTPYKPKNKKRR